MYLVVNKSSLGTYQWSVKQTTGRTMATGLPGFLTRNKAMKNFKQTVEVLTAYSKLEKDNGRSNRQTTVKN
jgi:hypothetical protein